MKEKSAQTAEQGEAKQASNPQGSRNREEEKG